MGPLHALKGKCQICAFCRLPLLRPGSTLHNNEKWMLLFMIRSAYHAKELSERVRNGASIFLTAFPGMQSCSL
eukprot:scaffold242811_cov15-Tisochrysis_lutea.AAC.1